MQVWLWTEKQESKDPSSWLKCGKRGEHDDAATHTQRCTPLPPLPLFITPTLSLRMYYGSSIVSPLKLWRKYTITMFVLVGGVLKR